MKTKKFKKVVDRMEGFTYFLFLFLIGIFVNVFIINKLIMLKYFTMRTLVFFSMILSVGWLSILTGSIGAIFIFLNRDVYWVEVKE